MIRRAAWVAVVCAIVATETAGRPLGPPARLVEIAAHEEAQRLAVLIRTSEPVAYAATQPDPLALLVELRHAVTDGVVNRLAGGRLPVTARVETGRALDGTPVGRVHLRLERADGHSGRVRAPTGRGGGGGAPRSGASRRGGAARR
jgi:hypothetical protein